MILFALSSFTECVLYGITQPIMVMIYALFSIIKYGLTAIIFNNIMCHKTDHNFMLYQNMKINSIYKPSCI